MEDGDDEEEDEEDYEEEEEAQDMYGFEIKLKEGRRRKLVKL